MVTLIHKAVEQGSGIGVLVAMRTGELTPSLETENENLPAQTSLQRKAKELMLAGGNIGSAYGILKEYGDIT